MKTKVNKKSVLPNSSRGAMLLKSRGELHFMPKSLSGNSRAWKPGIITKAAAKNRNSATNKTWRPQKNSLTASNSLTDRFFLLFLSALRFTPCHVIKNGSRKIWFVMLNKCRPVEQEFSHVQQIEYKHIPKILQTNTSRWRDLCTTLKPNKCTDLYLLQPFCYTIQHSARKLTRRRTLIGPELLNSATWGAAIALPKE